MKPCRTIGARQCVLQRGLALTAVLWAIDAIALLFLACIAAARYRLIAGFTRRQGTSAEVIANAALASYEVLQAIANRIGQSSPGPMKPGSSMFLSGYEPDPTFIFAGQAATAAWAWFSSHVTTCWLDPPPAFAGQAMVHEIPIRGVAG